MCAARICMSDAIESPRYRGPHDVIYRRAVRRWPSNVYVPVVVLVVVAHPPYTEEYKKKVLFEEMWTFSRERERARAESRFALHAHTALENRPFFMGYFCCCSLRERERDRAFCSFVSPSRECVCVRLSHASHFLVPLWSALLMAERWWRVLWPFLIQLIYFWKWKIYFFESINAEITFYLLDIFNKCLLFNKVYQIIKLSSIYLKYLCH